MRILPVWLLGTSVVLFTVGCKREQPQESKPTPLAAPKPIERRAQDTLQFAPVFIEAYSAMKALEDSLGEDRMLWVLKINRIDRDHVRDHDTLLVPTFFDERISPFPIVLNSAKQIHKLIIVSRRAQVFGAYDSGRLVRWGPTSTGKKKTPTPVGLYSANWKKDTAISTVDNSWILPWCVNIHNTEGISLHQFDLPGYPASHSCIRLLAEDAKWIFNWVDIWKLTPDAREVLAYGTPLIVFDDYQYGSTFLRKKILRDPKIHFVGPGSIDSVLAIHKAIIMDRQIARERLLLADSTRASSLPL